MSGQRRLAAILAADVVGYSRLMGADEERTVETLQVHRREVIDPLLTAFRGRVANTAGDSLLIEFASAVDALRCAVKIQKEIAARNGDVAADRRQVFRMGINVGDVISQGDDLLGDGVNVAARLEALAPSGGICISHTVRDQVRDRVDADFEDLGEVTVKNIARPVHAFRVLDAGEIAVEGPPARPAMSRTAMAAAAAVIAAAVGAAWWGVSRPVPPPTAGAEQTAAAIAVLPFANLSDDPGQAYFAKGIIEDITTDLSKVPGLHVPSQKATMRYKNGPADPKQIGTDLQVSHILEGSIRKAGEQLRITAKLIDARTGRQLWAERYDRSTSDVFAVQDDIANRVVSELSRNLGTPALKRRPRAYTPDLAAYDLYIQGRAKRIPPTPPNLAAALRLFERAMALDPRFAGGYAGAAYLHVLRYESPHVPDAAADQELQTALDLAETAVELDPEFGPAWGALALAYGRLRRFDDALEAIRKAMAKAPNDSLMRASYGQLLGQTGRAEDGIAEVRQAMRMAPDSLPMLFFLGANQRLAGRYDTAVETLVEHRRRLAGRILPAPTSQLIAAYVEAGQVAAGRAEVRGLMKAAPGFTVRVARRAHVYQDQDVQAAFEAALRRAGLPE